MISKGRCNLRAYIEDIGDDFLINNKTLERIKLNNAKKIGNNFLSQNI